MIIIHIELSLIIGQLYDSLEKAAQEECRSKPAKEAAWAYTVLDELRQRFSRLVGTQCSCDYLVKGQTTRPKKHYKCLHTNPRGLGWDITSSER